MEKSKRIRIISFPRIHLSLIGMNNDGYRINGGIGFSISKPSVSCCFDESDIIEIRDERSLKFTEKENRKLLNVLIGVMEQYNLKKNIKCVISSDAFPHYGFGTNTMIYLSCIEALFIINEFDYDKNLVVILSGRGGTSGVGINTYFSGGYVFDIGISNRNEELIPSSIADRKGLLPLVLKQCKSPEWQIGVCIPTYITNKSEQEEITFFRNNCPIEKSFVEKILYEAVYGITAGIIENNYSVFSKSINIIQKTQWKYLEHSLYGSQIIELEDFIKNSGADCVGMSSLGPSLFFFGNNIDGVISKITEKYSKVICFSGILNNRERIIYYD